MELTPEQYSALRLALQVAAVLFPLASLGLDFAYRQQVQQAPPPAVEERETGRAPQDW